MRNVSQLTHHANLSKLIVILVLIEECNDFTCHWALIKQVKLTMNHFHYQEVFTLTTFIGNLKFIPAPIPTFNTD